MRRALILFLVSLTAALAASAAFDLDRWEARRLTAISEARRLRAAYSNAVALATTPADKVRLPIENFADGTVKTLLLADQAQLFLDTGMVWGKGVTLEQYRADGKLEARITAASLIADRKRKVCWIEGHATAVRGRTSLEGENAYFEAEDGYLRLFNEAKIMSEDFELKGIKL